MAGVTWGMIPPLPQEKFSRYSGTLNFKQTNHKSFYAVSNYNPHIAEADIGGSQGSGQPVLPDGTASEKEMKRGPPPQTDTKQLHYRFTQRSVKEKVAGWSSMLAGSLITVPKKASGSCQQHQLFILLSALKWARGLSVHHPTPPEESVFQTLCHFGKTSHFTILFSSSSSC